MKTWIFYLLPILSILFLENCKSDKNEYNDTLSVALGLSPTYQSTITNVTPRKGAPYIKSDLTEYQASKVLISGRNFSYIPTDLTVTFNNIPATIEYSSDTQIFTSVPTGATSGLLKVTKSGGTCYSLDGKSGINCSALDFYIDCYSSSNKAYGDEILLTPGILNSVTYEDNGVKAFRSDLPAGNYTLNIACQSTIGVQTYSNSCSPVTQTIDGSSVLLNPQISITGGYTFQFLVYSIKSNCSIGIF